MAKILVSDGIDCNAAKALKSLGHELVEKFYSTKELIRQIKSYDVLIVRSATKVEKSIIEAAAAGKKLKLIIRAGVGVDNIDVEYAQEKGIAVANTPNASSQAVAELAIAQMFILARHLHKSNITMKKGEWNKKEYKGIELSGKKLGLIGIGRIARETAKRASALGMEVSYTCRSGEKEDCRQFEFKSKEDLLKSSDFVSLHIPYNKQTGTVIAKSEFDMMKQGAFLINCARGGTVDEAACLEALNNGKLAGAAIDVFKEEPTKNSKLLEHSNVSLSPHIGASTVEAQARIGAEILEIIKKRLI